VTGVEEKGGFHLKSQKKKDRRERNNISPKSGKPEICKYDSTRPNHRNQKYAHKFASERGEKDQDRDSSRRA